jgi:hypothetical protein
MTLPSERTRAVLNAQNFLRDMLDPAVTPRIPRDIRKQAYNCLRHYPQPFEMETVAKCIPSIFGPLEE